MAEQLGQPQIFNAPQMPTKKGRLGKVIFLIFGILLLFEIGILVKDYLDSPLPPKPVKSQPITEGSFSLVGPQSAKLGEPVKLQVFLSTGGHTVSGADLVLKYDSKVLEATPGAVANGKLFSEYPASTVDNPNGVIRVSGTAKEGEGVVGDGIFATVAFTPKSVGQTQVNVDFVKDGTKDSNILNVLTTGQDILGKVSNLSINIH